MKRTGFKQKPRKLLKRTKLRMRGVNETSVLKERVQELVRQVVIKRDGGCVFRKEKGHVCTGYANDGHLIYQADHLLPRSNSATFADTRLIVCVCKGIHGYKSVGSNLRKEEYDGRVKKLISKERVELWERCEVDRYKGSTRMTTYDWKLEIVNLESELKELCG